MIRVWRDFCIVSSDSDYTGLAKRIREEGLFVMGIGEKKTPESFVQSCDIFTYTENITPKIIDSIEIESIIETKLRNGNNKVQKNSKKHLPKKNSFLSEKDSKTISRAFDISTDENETAYISAVGANIRKIDPSFDTRTYNIPTLSKLFEKLDKFEVIKNEVGSLNHPLVKRK
ncbi:NYN domain-containing protein [Rhizosphaericola mali]|uniref:NYN domain-containing protein n=1 Tax=Rhizosphaericola mali TaxID=2545455 RepID=UPI0021072401|nr:NYN domain-containing protein [Rhizosphaericola mali]